ncbi:origin recognition complex subunit 1 isoform X2 [Cephus cinctus]|uniref:Origin recognition complex subunit 1 n=1 Tax=Cephus cinctus TaxID=211228 RepID=A0AAJ7FDP0_CEPCN|nr:origin recognition complex subunit 1 isoform X2 [Cephus cinctus]
MNIINTRKMSNTTNRRKESSTSENSSVESEENSVSDSENSKRRIRTRTSTKGTPLKSNHTNVLRNKNSETNESKYGEEQLSPKKRKRVTRSTSEESLEPRSRSVSPEISYEGPPATYKLYENNGQSLVIKKPLNIEVHRRSKKCNELDISNLLNSDSDSDNIFTKIKDVGAKIVAMSKSNCVEELELLSTPKNKLDTPKNREVTVAKEFSPKKARRNLSDSLDTEGCISSEVLLKKLEKKREDASLKIKLRRSTEQSHYKIDSDSDLDYETCSRKTVVSTPRNIVKASLKKSTTPAIKIKTNVEGNVNVSDKNEIKKSLEVHVDQTEVRKSRRVRTPSTRYTDYKTDADETPTIHTSKLRTRKSINYNEHNLFNNHIIVNTRGTPSKTYSQQNTAVTPRTTRRTRSLIPKNFINQETTASSPLKNTTKVSTPTKREVKKEESDSESSNSMIFDQISTKTPERATIATKNVAATHRTTRQNSTEILRENETQAQHSLISNEVQPDIKMTMSNTEAHKTPRKSTKLLDVTEASTPRRRNVASRTKEEPGFSTPKRSTKTAAKSHTPSSIKHRNLTPSMHQRNAVLLKPTTALEEARARLHVSAVPKSLPCREEEFNNIYTFLERKLLDNSGGCMYISGVPGTGKTATVNEVIRCLKKLVSKHELNDFKFIEINGMKLTEPRQAYVHILKQLTNRTATWEQAYQLLEKQFIRPTSKKCMTLLLVDELDLLCNKRQDVVYNLLDWPTKLNAQLVVITIANTMDLPERVLMGRVTSRLGLTRLTFQPYNHKQLQEIVITRLKDSNAFRSEAIQLVARKVAAVSGDARRALDICRRATEIAESHDAGTVSMQDVNEALTEMIASAKVQAIRHCSEMERTFLQAVSAEIARTGIEEAIFKNVFKQFEALCSFDGVKTPSITESLGICARLGAYRLLICEHSRADITQRILLNVSSDDIHFSMQDISI